MFRHCLAVWSLVYQIHKPERTTYIKTRGVLGKYRCFIVLTCELLLFIEMLPNHNLFQNLLGSSYYLSKCCQITTYFRTYSGTPTIYRNVAKSQLISALTRESPTIYRYVAKSQLISELTRELLLFVEMLPNHNLFQHLLGSSYYLSKCCQITTYFRTYSGAPTIYRNVAKSQLISELTRDQLLLFIEMLPNHNLFQNLLGSSYYLSKCCQITPYFRTYSGAPTIYEMLPNHNLFQNLLGSSYYLSKCCQITTYFSTYSGAPTIYRSVAKSQLISELTRELLLFVEMLPNHNLFQNLLGSSYYLSKCCQITTYFRTYSGAPTIYRNVPKSQLISALTRELLLFVEMLPNHNIFQNLLGSSYYLSKCCQITTYFRTYSGAPTIYLNVAKSQTYFRTYSGAPTIYRNVAKSQLISELTRESPPGCYLSRSLVSSS